MKAPETAPRTCAFCGCPVEDGGHSIHRDAFGEGPEVPLCTPCGSSERPTEREIWAKIGQSEYCIQCEEEIRASDARTGSFHEWCT